MQKLKSIKYLIFPIFLTLFTLLNAPTRSIAGVYFPDAESISAEIDLVKNKKPIKTKKRQGLKRQKAYKFSFLKKDSPSRFGVIGLLCSLGVLVFLILATASGSLVFSVLTGLFFLGSLTFSLWGTRVDKKPRLAKILLVINLAILLLLLAGSVISVLVS